MAASAQSSNGGEHIVHRDETSSIAMGDSRDSEDFPGSDVPIVAKG